MNSHTLAAALAQRWREQGVLSSEVASSEQIERFEKAEQVVLPADSRTYLQLVNGTGGQGGCDDGNILAFFTFDEIEEYECAKHVYVFADYLQKCWAFAIALGHPAFPDGVIFRVGMIPDLVQIATSFSEFVATYFEDPNRLIFPNYQASE